MLRQCKCKFLLLNHLECIVRMCLFLCVFVFTCLLSLPKILSLFSPPRQVSASFEAATYYECCVPNYIKIWTWCAHVKLSVVHVVLQRSTETSFTGPRQGTCQKKSGEKPVRAKTLPFTVFTSGPAQADKNANSRQYFFLFFLLYCFIGASAKATETEQRPYGRIGLISADRRGLLRVMRAKCPPSVTTMKGHCS